MGEQALRVVLVGGSGFLGRGLRKRLVNAGHEVTVIGRGPASMHDGWQHVQWDATSHDTWVRSLEGADVVAHLAGKRVDCRPTASNINELISSRVDTVRLVGEAVRSLDDPPKAWVQLSSLGIFGDSDDTIIDETSPIPTSGLRQQVEVCRQWEAAFDEAAKTIERTVLLRPAITIGGIGDPTSIQLARLARLGLGGSIGSGSQWVSWISNDDMFNLLHRAVADPSMSGLYHLTSPEPVRNRALMAAYRRAVGRSFGLPAPAFVTKIGAWLLGSDPALALTGRRCVPQRLLAEGYEFVTTDINDAVGRAVNT